MLESIDDFVSLIKLFETLRAQLIGANSSARAWHRSGTSNKNSNIPQPNYVENQLEADFHQVYESETRLGTNRFLLVAYKLHEFQSKFAKMKRRTSSEESEAQRNSREGISNVRTKPLHIYDNITRRLLQIGKFDSCWTLL